MNGRGEGDIRTIGFFQGRREEILTISLLLIEQNHDQKPHNYAGWGRNTNKINFAVLRLLRPLCIPPPHLGIICSALYQSNLVKFRQ